MTGRRLGVRVAAVGSCALISTLAIVWTSNAFLLTGSVPATIWAPRGGVTVAAALVAAAVAGVAFAGRRARLFLLLLWLAILAIVTHRIVDIGPDGLRDLWFGIPVRTFGSWHETDADPQPCGLSLCITRAGHTYSLPTILPFAPVR